MHWPSKRTGFQSVGSPLTLKLQARWRPRVDYGVEVEVEAKVQVQVQVQGQKKD